jgi:hypothetical protein
MVEKSKYDFFDEPAKDKPKGKEPTWKKGKWYEHVTIDKKKLLETIRRMSENGKANSLDTHKYKVLFDRCIRLRKDGKAPRDAYILNYLIEVIEENQNVSKVGK